MKRYRVSTFDFDSRPLRLAMESKDESEEQVKAQHRANKERVREGYLCRFGLRLGERKLRNIVDLGPKPWSIVAFPNKLLEQARDAFIVGAYYPAHTAACAFIASPVQRCFWNSSPSYRCLVTLMWRFLTTKIMTVYSMAWHAPCPCDRACQGDDLQGPSRNRKRGLFEPSDGRYPHS